MKTIIFCLAIVSLFAAQKPVLQKDRQVLFDFRVVDEAAAAKLAPATQRMVLTKVFRKYLTDANRCTSQFSAGDAEDPLAAARKGGLIVTYIAATETGS